MIQFEDIEISVCVIPAHNEEKYIERCIYSIRNAAENYNGKTEIIVVCNRCTDHTDELAKKSGARVIYNEDRCIAKVRNAGIAAAEGDIIITIDSDNRMTKGTIREVVSMLDSGKYIGGGASIRFERYSFPLVLNDFLCRISFRMTGLYCGIFWAEKKTLEVIGGFVEKKAMEDVATAKKLKKYGKKNGKKYGHLKQNYLINSTRKYDALGDWLYFKLLFCHVGAFIKAAFGNTKDMDSLLDQLFYDYEE